MSKQCITYKGGVLMIDKMIELIKSEMQPSLGCTEPVAIGLAVSRTCQYLQKPATKLEMHISSNIFKNAYSVTIPNAGKPGIQLACALGFLLSKPDNTMEIFSSVTSELVKEAEKLVEDGFVEIHIISSSQFYIEVYALNDKEKAHTITVDKHDNLVKVEKDGAVLLDNIKQTNQEQTVASFDITKYTFEDFIRIAETVEIEKLQFIKEAVEMNLHISEVGMKQKYALGIGPALNGMMINKKLSNDLVTTVKSVVSAACDFRMSGGNGSVMTFLGSGNQGLEATLPIAVTAKYLNLSEEKMLRAEMLGLMITIYIKYHVGRLSPICGATLSGAGSSAGITWLLGGSKEAICGAVQNMLGCLAGMLCDGAKGGCALKLSTSAGEAVYSALYALDNSIIQPTDGIISQNVEDTVKNVATLSLEGMAEVDMKIIDIMMHKK